MSVEALSVREAIVLLPPGAWFEIRTATGSSLFCRADCRAELSGSYWSATLSAVEIYTRSHDRARRVLTSPNLGR
jgi:hypothetical protein